MADDRRPAGSGNPINRLVVTQAPVRAVAPAASLPEQRLPWLSGLDGLRAIAVAAVVLYHAGVAALPGGFLGVEVFFVISGYLITGLLLAEWQATGRVGVRAFWLRRARRLLPALYLLLLVVLAVTVVSTPDAVTQTRGDAAAAAGYVANWNLVYGEQSYFAAAERPSPLLHLWSLGVEEQFYLAWPVVLAVGLAVLRRRAMLVVTIAGAVASAIWMGWLFEPGTDPSRVYYGTDTRLTGLLGGAALAFIWLPGRSTGPGAASWSRRSTLAADGAALGGLGLLAVAFATVHSADPRLYQGGLAVVALATAMLIGGAVHPANHLSRWVLDRRPMRWLGSRSYAVYLWHWPVIVMTRPNLEVPLDGLALLGVQVGLTLLAAEASFRWVEAPIRRGAIGRAWHAWREAPGMGRRGAIVVRGRLASLAAVVALSVSGLLVTVAAADPPARPSYLPVDEIQGVLIGSVPETGRPTGDPTDPTDPPPPSAEPTAPAATEGPATRPARSPATGQSPSHSTPRPKPARDDPTPLPRPTPTPAPPEPDVLAIGDSVLIDTAPALAAELGRVEVDARIGRHVDEGVRLLEKRQRAGTLPDIVIIGLGTNGPLYKDQFERAMAALAEVPTVLWVSVTVPRSWEDHTNLVLRELVPRYPNARLVDWHALSADRPDLFWRDGYHPRPAGAELYAELVAAALGE